MVGFPLLCLITRGYIWSKNACVLEFGELTKWSIPRFFLDLGKIDRKNQVPFSIAKFTRRVLLASSSPGDVEKFIWIQ